MALETLEQVGAAVIERVPTNTDLIELYYERGWSDGLPVVPPTQEKIDAVVAALGGDPQFVECKVAPRWGALTREILAINMVMAGCRPEYAPIVRAAMLALTDRAFNLNGVQATTHVASPLIVVNGPLAAEVGMNGGPNAFGSGNRANATIGRAVRLIMLNVGGGWPPDFDKSTLGHPGKYSYCVAENELDSPFAPYHVEHGYSAMDFDRVRDRRGSTPQRDRPSVQRPGRRPRHNVLGDEHHRLELRRPGRTLHRRARSRTCEDDRQGRLDPLRHPPLPLDEFGQRVPPDLPRPPLRQGL